MNWKFWQRRRSQDDPENLRPTSLEEYYASQDHHGASSWLVAIATFFITLALAIGLFMAVRWTVNKINNNAKPGNVAQQPASDTNKQKTQNGGNQSGNSGGSQGQPTVNAPTTATNPPTIPPSTETTPSSRTLSNTGPGSLMALFVCSTILAGSLHYAYTIKKLKA